MGQASNPRSPISDSSFSHAWRALRHRNFKLFFVGQSISLIGTWMTRLATSWLVYRLTHSALLLGVVELRRARSFRLLLAPSPASGSSASIAASCWCGPKPPPPSSRSPWPRSPCRTSSSSGKSSRSCALQGLINAFDMPGRQSFLVQMVDDRNDLSNAIAINSSMANGARLIGPAIAGLVIAAVGEGWCFLIDGISYFAVIASLLLMRITAAPHIRRNAGPACSNRCAKAGTTSAPSAPSAPSFSSSALISLMGWPYSVLLPIFAGQVLAGHWRRPHSGSHLSAGSPEPPASARSMSGLSLAFRKSVVGLTRMLQIAAAMLGGALILFGLSRTLWLSLALMVFVGFGLMQGAAASNTIIQSLVPEDKRARVMSYYTMAFFGSAPFGSLLAGALAHRIGAPHTVMVTGAFCVAGSLWFTLQLPKVRAVMRPIYQEMGLLQDSAAVEVESS